MDLPFQRVRVGLLRLRALCHLSHERGLVSFDCAHRGSTFLSCALCEQGRKPDRQLNSPVRVARAEGQPLCPTLVASESADAEDLDARLSSVLVVGHFLSRPSWNDDSGVMVALMAGAILNGIDRAQFFSNVLLDLLAELLR